MASGILKWILIALGTVSVALGVLGTLLPLLPTTPFLLLAAACYARSSERLHSWLFTNRLFGSYLRSYAKGEGLPLRVKVLVIVMLWAAIGYSAAYVVTALAVRVILVLLALGVTTYILMLKTARGDCGRGSPTAGDPP
jgi:uncharacterized membrane protein YbaN (DUF454 family)